MEREVADMHMREQAESVGFEESESEPAQSNVEHRRIPFDAEFEASNYDENFEDHTEMDNDTQHRRIPVDQSTVYSEEMVSVVRDEWEFSEKSSNAEKKPKSNEIIID